MNWDEQQQTTIINETQTQTKININTEENTNNQQIKKTPIEEKEDGECTPEKSPQPSKHTFVRES